MYRIIIMILATMCLFAAEAQSVIDGGDIAVASPHDNWYVQVGIDMSLQHPYGIGLTTTNSVSGKKENIFNAGRTQGIVVAAGRWFTPALGLRGRVNWENGFVPFGNKKATWLNFMNPAFPHGGEVNAEHGGYMSVVGDVQFDIHGMFCPYREDRLWNLQIFPRGGLVYNIALHKGSPLIGAGIGNTFRINPRCSIFFDVAYQMVSSGFNGKGTGVGSGANGYFDATLGVQMNLGRSGFSRIK